MRLTRETEQRLLEVLEIHESAGDVAVATGLPLRQVIHYQRLYGPAHLQFQRAKEDHERVKALRQEIDEAERESPLRPRRRRPDRIIEAIQRQRKARWRR